MARYVGKRIVPKHCGYWDSAKSYEMQSIVYHRASGNSYISRRAVPAGTDISQTDYWALCSDFNEQMEMLDRHVTESEAAIRADNEATRAAVISDNDATETAIRADNAATANAVKEDNAATKSHVDSSLAQTTNSLGSRMDTIEARLDSNVTASTDRNADYAAEVVDARAGWDAAAYRSLGTAIRGQMGQALKYAGYLTRNKGTEDLNDLEANTVYHVSSDVGETTLKNFPDYGSHGVIITTGETGGFMYQIFYGGGGDRIFLRYHIASGWHPWADLFEDTEAEFDAIYRNIRLFGMEDILHRGGIFPKTLTCNGVAFTANDDGSITADGTAEEDVPGFYNMYASYEARMDGIEAGETYVFRLTGDTGIMRLEAYVDMDGTASKWTQFISTDGLAEAAVPEGSSGFLIRVMVPPGKSVEGATVYPSVTRKYTPEEYHRKTLEYLAQSLRHMGSLTRNGGTEDLDSLEANSVYLVSSSAGETTIMNFPDFVGHGILITAGAEGGYTYQFFFTHTVGKLFLRFRYGNGTWAEWRNIAEGPSLAEFHCLQNTLRAFGVEDLLHEHASFPKTLTCNGITFTANDDGSVTVDGTAAEDVPGFYNMYADYGTRMEGIEAGETYVFRITGDTGKVWLEAYVDADGTASKWTKAASVNGLAEVTVPEGSSGFLVRLAVAKGVTVENATVYPSISRRYTAEEYYGKVSGGSADTLRYAGSLNRIGDTVDLDSIETNTIYLVSSNTGETTLLNFPDYGSHGLLVTAGAEGGFTYQLFIGYDANSIFLRFRYGNGTWAEWRNITDTGASADGFRGTNPNSRMLSYGNSILSGSVWTEEHYNHLSAYYNAPYGVIANAIGIPKDNVEHTVVSSTGLLYDAGQGSFLENIKATDLTGYDVVLTHLWTADMNKYKVGAVDAEAGDGTIAGGVAELVRYMRESNGQCQLILVGVPPVSSTIYGDGVFTTAYPNGSTIEELDTVMHEMAEKYHFVYLDWQGLNLSYYYHDYSDGTNVHANNEDTYRVMGAYLGGRASAQIRF